jgi:putative hydrolase of the HAD superfamily
MIIQSNHDPLLQTTPQGLLLDFGAVMSISVFERHAQTEAILGLPAGTLTWLGALNPKTDPLWLSMQQDEISERDYWQARASELGKLVGESQWSVIDMLTRIRQVDPNAVIRPEMTKLIQQAKAAGLRIGILSNEMELFYGKAFLDQMAILKDIDCVVDATHTHTLKPDPDAYALGVAAMGLAAEDILFVDDQFRNISGAVKAGLQVHYFELRDIAGNFSALTARLGLHN